MQSRFVQCVVTFVGSFNVLSRLLPLLACLTPDRAIVTPTQTHTVTFGDPRIKPGVPNNLLLPPSLTFAQH